MGMEQRSKGGARLVPGVGPGGAATMRAAVRHLYGPPSVLESSEVGPPLPGRSDVLVQVGASGGVGSFAVQIAKAFGAEVARVCSTRNVDLVRSLGADHVVDYTKTNFTRTEKRYDAILDNVEAQPLAAARRALTPAER